MLLTFNNSVAYIDLPAGHPHKIPFPYHGVPMTRAAIEDPGNRGMIVSRPWFEDLTDSQFEHMKKAALDVVQFRVDERLLAGIARAFGSSPAGGEGGLLPKPNVLIRVTPSASARLITRSSVPRRQPSMTACPRRSSSRVIRAAQ